MSLLEKDKRKFSVIIGSKKCGACSGASPSGAARKVKGKSGAFYLKEMTKGSKKKLYGPYSSKKKIVQRGGEEKRNILREMICENVLNILKQCDSIDTFDAEMNRINTDYKILEQAYLYLRIKDRTDKCNVLKDIIEVRDKYFILIEKNSELKHFPLCYCLCYLTPEKNNAVEIGFINFNFNKIIMSRIKSLTIRNKDNFYTNNWSIFIQFLRNIIRQIEVDKLTQSKNELSKLNAEVQRAKANYQARMGKSNLGSPAEEEYEIHKGESLPNYLLDSNKNNTSVKAGPAEEKKNYRPHPKLLRAVGRKVNQKPNQPLTLEERLAALLEND